MINLNEKIALLKTSDKRPSPLGTGDIVLRTYTHAIPLVRLMRLFFPIINPVNH